MKTLTSILWLALAVATAGAARAQTNDARLTQAERVMWTHLNQRAAAAVPSHVLWFNDGRGLVGWLRGETNGAVQWDVPFGADGRWRMQIERADLSHAEALSLKPPAINYCDVSFQLEFPDLRLIRAPPYSMLTDEAPQSAERYLGALQLLHTNFVERFGALTEGLGLPDHVQVLLFTDEDEFHAYRRRMLGRRPTVLGFYRPEQQRLTVFDQRYLAALTRLLGQIAWESEKLQVKAPTDEAADWYQLTMLSTACNQMRVKEAANLRVLRHEGAHQLFHASGILVEGATPGWLAEGLALWCETRVPGAINYECAATVQQAQSDRTAARIALPLSRADARRVGKALAEIHRTVAVQPRVSITSALPAPPESRGPRPEYTGARW